MIQIRLSKLHAEQQAIVKSAARFKVVVCGRRFGKTTLAVDTICNRLIDGEVAAYFAPTYRMAAEVWREVKERLFPIIREAREHEWRLAVYPGGVFECWSLANQAAETVRGRKYDYVVMDEAALFDSADVWHGAIRPLLTDTGGGAMFCSTPRGRNWFWQLYLQGQNPDFPEWQSWRLPTLANPHIQSQEVEAARVDMPERFFKQEYLAEFLDDGGVVFRDVEQVCVGEEGLSAEYKVLSPEGERKEGLSAEVKVLSQGGEGGEVASSEYLVPRKEGEEKEVASSEYPVVLTRFGGG